MRHLIRVMRGHVKTKLKTVTKKKNFVTSLITLLTHENNNLNIHIVTL